MPRLPNLTAQKAIRAFEAAGFLATGQEGSHVRLEKGNIKLIIPNHPGDLKCPLLKALIKQAGLTEAEFRELL
jgi:predicted RNA binding protein YcfA (HicA-like mRNA interferase family)